MPRAISVPLSFFFILFPPVSTSRFRCISRLPLATASFNLHAACVYAVNKAHRERPVCTHSGTLLMGLQPSNETRLRVLKQIFASRTATIFIDDTLHRLCVRSRLERKANAICVERHSRARIRPI